jgi:hypothetical protein
MGAGAWACLFTGWVKKGDITIKSCEELCPPAIALKCQGLLTWGRDFSSFFTCMVLFCCRFGNSCHGAVLAWLVKQGPIQSVANQFPDGHKKL